jgi:hypothetical protein
MKAIYILLVIIDLLTGYFVLRWMHPVEFLPGGPFSLLQIVPSILNGAAAVITLISLVILCLSGCFSKPQYIALNLCWTALGGPSRPVSPYMRWAYVRFRGQARFGMRPWVVCVDCDERRIHQGKPGADHGSRRDRSRSAIAGEIADGAVSQRQHWLCAFPQIDSQGLGARHMLESGFLQPRKAFEAVGVYGRTRHHILFQESQKRCVFEIRDQSHPSTPGHLATFLHDHQHQRGFAPLQLPASPQSGLSAANPGLVPLPLCRAAARVPS